jgi:hypothetical protein
MYHITVIPADPIFNYQVPGNYLHEAVGRCNLPEEAQVGKSVTEDRVGGSI